MYNHPPQLKVSPIAATPHKSRPFRMILDLSFRLKVNNMIMPSVNDSTVKLGPQEALNYIGSALPRLIYAMATARQNYPMLFTKADIQDGFWKIFTDEEGRWNFACVLPQTKDHQDISIVVPNGI